MSHATGGCLCGRVRYEITADPILQLACYCRDCQYAGGGAPALIAVVPKAQLAVTKGEPKTFWSKGDSGGDVGRSFCADCGSPLFSEPKSVGVFALKIGSLDDPSKFHPQFDIWMKSAQPWHRPHEGAARFEEGPSR